MICSQCKRSHPTVSDEERNRLLVQHRDLVLRTARKIHRNLPSSIELDDLVSFGTFGLMRAIEHFDPESGVHFETYAVAAIRGVIADELRSQDWAPRSLRKKQRTVAQAATELERKLGREPTDEEIAKKIGESVTYVQSTRQEAANASHSSLDERHGDQASQYDQIASTTEEDPLRAIAHSEVFLLATREIAGLSTQDLMVIVLYYHEMLTLKDIGAVLGIPETRASQIHVRCACAIRQHLELLLAV